MFNAIAAASGGIRKQYKKLGRDKRGKQTYAKGPRPLCEPERHWQKFGLKTASDSHLYMIRLSSRSRAMTRFFKETWASRRDAELWSIKEKADGVGVMFSAVGNDLLLGGVDLDTCRNVQTGELESWESEVVARFQSYTEVSPSQTGANLFFTYDIGEQEKIKAILGGVGRSFKKGGNGP